MRFPTVPALCLLAFGLASFATASQADFADDREAAMKHIRNNYRTLVDMAKSGSFDPATARTSAGQIAEDLSAFKDLFPEGSEHADKASDPAIWSDRDGFEAAWQDARDAASKVAAVTEADAYVPAVQELAGACRSCHKKFVVPEN